MFKLQLHWDNDAAWRGAGKHDGPGQAPGHAGASDLDRSFHLAISLPDTLDRTPSTLPTTVPHSTAVYDD